LRDRSSFLYIGPSTCQNLVVLPAIIYAAKSTADERGSIPTQLADCRAAAEAEGREIVAEFKDEKASAYKGNRGTGLTAAKDAAIKHGAELWVQHSDRLARGDGITADHLAEIWFALRRHGVRIRSVQDDSNLEDAIRVVLIGERNHEDSKRKSAATKAGKRRRFERGDSAGPLQFGYRLVKVVAEDNSVITRRVPEPDEASVVLQMYKLLDEGHNVGDITRWVNSQGVRTKRSKTFGRNAVRTILANPWYGGKVRQQGELRDGNHEPLMSWNEWQRITGKRQRLDAATLARRRGGRPSDVALLSGVLVCAHCGGGIWHRKNGAQRHYVCGNVRHATGACDARRFDARFAEEAVAEHLSTIFVDFASWLDNLTRERALQRDGLVRESAALHVRLAALQNDEQLVRKDYLRQLRAEKTAAADVAASELERIGKEHEAGAEALADLDARLAEWDEEPDANGALDWWNDFSAAAVARSSTPSPSATPTPRCGSASPESTSPAATRRRPARRPSRRDSTSF
jgi:DNA invertase Pin-like site-specific DNA recombinase